MSTSGASSPSWVFGFTRSPHGDRVVQPFLASRARQRHYAGMPYAAVLLDGAGATLASLEVGMFAPEVLVTVFDGEGERVLERRFAASVHRHFLFAERDTTYTDQSGGRAARPRTRNFVEQARAGGVRDGRVIPGARLHHRLEPVPDFAEFAGLLRTDRRRSPAQHADGAPSRLALQATGDLLRELARDDARRGVGGPDAEDLPPGQVC